MNLEGSGNKDCFTSPGNSSKFLAENEGSLSLLRTLSSREHFGLIAGVKARHCFPLSLFPEPQQETDSYLVRLQHARTLLGKTGYQDVLLLWVYLVVAQTALELRINRT